MNKEYIKVQTHVKNYVALSSTFQNCGNMEVLDALEYS
jgi:hypothetical protein